MNSLFKSITILLHAIVITALLSNLGATSKNSGVQIQQNSTPFLYQAETVTTTQI